MSDSFTNYNYVGNTKVSVSIKKTYEYVSVLFYYFILFDDKILLYIKIFNK